MGIGNGDGDGVPVYLMRRPARADRPGEIAISAATVADAASRGEEIVVILTPIGAEVMTRRHGPNGAGPPNGPGGGETPEDPVLIVREPTRFAVTLEGRRAARGSASDSAAELPVSRLA